MYKLNKDQLKFIKDNEENFKSNNWKAIVKNYNSYYNKLDLEGIGDFFLEVFGEDFLKYIGDTIPHDFFAFGDLTSIVIPNSITKIDEYAFYTCDSLQSITLPNSITEICEYTFYSCMSLKSIIIPNSVKKIIGCAFENCTSLKSITLPNSVKEIEESAFWRCTSLKSIKVYHNSYAEEWCRENDFEDKIEYLD